MTRGWTGAGRLMLAESEQPIRYGTGIIKTESVEWPTYLMVSGDRASAAAKPLLDHPPAQVVLPASLSDDDLVGCFGQIDTSTLGLVVGLGGGMAIDAAKYAALNLDLPLVQAPSVTSTGAIVHSYWGSFVGRGQIRGTKNDWPYVDPEAVLVDADLVLKAPLHLNTAGLGDSLCLYAGIIEMRAAGDRPELASIVEEYDRLVEEFTSSLDATGKLTEASPKVVVEALRERHRLRLPGVDFVQGEHAFERYLEIANDRSWVHGELTALGSVIIAWSYDDDVDRLVSWLDRCLVRWRPQDQDISEGELQAGLAVAPTALPPVGPYNWDTILAREPVTGPRFDALWSFLTSV